MGTGSSKSPKYEHAVVVFTAKEKEQIVAIYTEVCNKKSDGFDNAQLSVYIGNKLFKSLCEKAYGYMKKVQEDIGGPDAKLNCIRHDAFAASLAYMLKGSADEKAAMVCHMTGNEQTITLEHLSQLVGELIEAYEENLKACDEFATWTIETTAATTEQLTQALLSDLNSTERGEAKSEFSADEVQKWLSKCGILVQLIDTVLHRCFPVSYVEEAGLDASQSHLFPVCEGADWTKFSTILNVPSVLLLNYNLLPELRSPWRLLFSSRVHGESFSNLVKHITKQGPNILVIKDMDGNVFGGFASESWSIRPQFVGSSRCYLFTLHPTMQIYSASGINENYIYLNQGQETMPNGLGMGGQLEYFGLWLDSEYGQGHSKAQPSCTTFGSPQLSAKENFNIDVLEVWGVGMDPAKHKLEEEDGEEKKESILDKDPEAKAMLAMINRGPVSDGLRETDVMAGSPGEEHLPPL